MYKYKMLFVILTAFCLLVPTLLYSQVDTAWVRGYNGPGNNYDYACAIVVDNAGNVYVTGRSRGANYDYATIKYNSNGSQEWVARYNGAANGEDEAIAIVVDNQGNVYVTGYSYGGSTVFNDYVTIKYNSQGNQEWVARYNSPTNDIDEAKAIAVDNQGNVYVTGVSSNDYLTMKYNSAGTEVWSARYNAGPGNSIDYPSAIAIDGDGNVYVTGTGRDDYLTIKYSNSGNIAWTARYNGPTNSIDEAYALAVDNAGNVYVTGKSWGLGTYYDYATIKYNPQGNQEWIARYNGTANYYDEAYSIALDNQGNIFVTGYSNGLNTSADYTTIKYNSQGNQQWVVRYDEPVGSVEYAYDLAVDYQGNVYVTGFSWSAPGTGADYTTIKYNTNGEQQWVTHHNGSANNTDEPSAIVVDALGNVYVTGSSYEIGTFFDYATIKYVQASGIEESEIASLPHAMTQKVVIYPNPAKSHFTVRLPKTADRSEIKIFDVTGKQVGDCHGDCLRQPRNDNRVQVSLDGIKNGIYFVKVNDEMVKEKLVVTK